MTERRHDVRLAGYGRKVYGRQPQHRLGVLRRAVLIALVVGTCLTLINQGDILFSRHFTSALLWKIPLSYLVPFLVSMYSALAAPRSKE